MPDSMEELLDDFRRGMLSGNQKKKSRVTELKLNAKEQLDPVFM
jgi:hypothetical protein